MPGSDIVLELAKSARRLSDLSYAAIDGRLSDPVRIERAIGNTRSTMEDYLAHRPVSKVGSATALRKSRNL